MGSKKTEPTLDEVTDYVITHTSDGPQEYEFKEAGGSIIVSFDNFVKMVEEGYNIYDAVVLNEKLISIKFDKGRNRPEGRGRF